MPRKPRVLLLGATNAAARVVLRLLRRGPVEITVATELCAAREQAGGEKFDLLMMCDPGEQAILSHGGRLESGKLELDRVRQRVRHEGEQVFLTPHEYRILEQLMLNSGAVVSRDQIRLAVWGELSSASNAVDVHLGHLRRKLLRACGTRVIHTVRGQGYVLRAETAECSEGHKHANPRD